MEIMYPLNLIVERSWWQVLAITLFICPILPFIIEGVQYRRWIPITPSKQFYAFWPGNLFLAVFITTCSVGLKHSGGEGWFEGNGCHAVVLVSAFVVYLALNVLDLTSPYTKEQLASVFKGYHNSLYFWYGYVAVMTFIGMLSSTLSWEAKLAATLPGVVWLGCLIADNLRPAEVTAERMRHAHSPVQS